jgi:hypothetical protein
LAGDYGSTLYLKGVSIQLREAEGKKQRKETCFEEKKRDLEGT